MNMNLKKKYILIPIALVALVFACKQVIDEQQADQLVTPVSEPVKTVEVAEVKSLQLDNIIKPPPEERLI